MNSFETHDRGSGQSRSDHETRPRVLQDQQQEWEAFAVRAVQIIPALKAQMTAVTTETERAAIELMVHLRRLCASDDILTPQNKAASLSKIVMAMQFQDMTRQKLEHVGLALDQLRSHMQVLLKGPPDEDARKEIAALLQVEHMYTMEEERRLHEAAMQPDYEEPVPSDLTEDAADSVTLF